MYYILGFVGKYVDESRIRNLIIGMHKEDYKTPNVNLKVNVIFLSERMLDESLKNQLSSLNSNLKLELKNKINIVYDMYRNKINDSIHNYGEITYIIINDIKDKNILSLAKSYRYSKIYFISNNKCPMSNLDFYTYTFVNKLIFFLYGYVYLEHLYEKGDEWININIKGEYDFKLIDSIKMIRKFIHNNIQNSIKIKKVFGV